TRATVTIRDAAGQVVKTIELGPQAGGQVPLWGDAGPGLPAGTYQLEIAAVAASGAAVTAAPVIHGAITSIGFGADGATLRVGGLVLNPADIASVS
ncbi:MAG: hypothetical protein KC464_15165, partial [Myxococcales bacterium]|nr:hypothetical protein [Myxococcales bacterium]